MPEIENNQNGLHPQADKGVSFPYAVSLKWTVFHARNVKRPRPHVGMIKMGSIPIERDRVNGTTRLWGNV